MLWRAWLYVLGGIARYCGGCRSVRGGGGSRPRLAGRLKSRALCPRLRSYVVCLAFSGNGQRLATVTGDNRHTVSVWHWKSKTVIHADVGHNGQPPQVGAVLTPERVHHETLVSIRVTPLGAP